MTRRLPLRVIDPEAVADGNYVLTVAGGVVTGLALESGGGGGVGSVLTAYKTANETITNTTLQNDDHLFIAAGASEIWGFTAHLHASSASATPDLKVYAYGPAGSTIRRVGGIGLSLSVSGSIETSARAQSHTTGTIAFGVPASATSAGFGIFTATVEVAGTAGNVGLQFAQSTTDGSNGITLHQGTYLSAVRLA